MLKNHRALFGLDVAEGSELLELLGASPDDASFDLTATAIALAAAGPLETMPAHLAHRIASSAPAAHTASVHTPQAARPAPSPTRRRR